MVSEKAIVLTSGGLDSTTVLAIAKDQGFTLIALSFDYGQRHRYELQAASRVAASMRIAKHVIFPIDLRQFGGSALTDQIPVPRDQLEESPEAAIPLTYVPARNTVFLSLALALAETEKAAHIFIGVNAVDYSGYPDCRPEYIARFQDMANLATRDAVQGHPIVIHTPLIQWSKAKIIQTGLNLGVDYSLTHSCYDPDPQGHSCGHCDSCLLRLKGFAEVGIPDPLPYSLKK